MFAEIMQVDPTYRDKFWIYCQDEVRKSLFLTVIDLKPV